MTLKEALQDKEFSRLYDRFFWHRQQFRDLTGTRAGLALENARIYAYDMITWLENRGLLKDDLCEEITAQQERGA